LRTENLILLRTRQRGQAAADHPWQPKNLAFPLFGSSGSQSLSWRSALHFICHLLSTCGALPGSRAYPLPHNKAGLLFCRAVEPPRPQRLRSSAQFGSLISSAEKSSCMRPYFKRSARGTWLRSIELRKHLTKSRNSNLVQACKAWPWWSPIGTQRLTRKQRPGCSQAKSIAFTLYQLAILRLCGTSGKTSQESLGEG
jgi:hypothetical protein